MTSSSERRTAPPSERRLAPRGQVLRGSAVATIQPAALGALRPVTDPAEAGVDPRVLEEARADAARRGYADGHRAGVAAAAEEAARAAAARDAAVERTLEAVAGTVEAFVARQGEALAALEDQLAGAALELAEAILGRELALAEAPGRDAIARAMQLAGEARQATVRLHPADVATLGQVEGIAPGRELTVVADPAVEPGGCLLEAGATRVDARLGSALERVREVLAG
jgi:flagellar assembly protein FliH